MKFQFKNIAIAMVATLALVSCSNDDDSTNQVTGNGNLKVEFDQIYNDADFAANTPYTNSNGEVVKVNNIKYIVSNIVLTKEDGSTYTIPKNESYYIVDEFTPASTLIELTNIPAGNYTKISYGIGVDQEQFNLGATGQGNFLTQAQDAGMMWSWSAGYKFLALEGTFTSSTVTTDTQFMVHTGQTGTDYNYTTITLDLPENALVRTTITPQIHIMADLKHIIDGTNKIALSDGPMVMGGNKLALVTTNLSNMFEVHHVHND
ncbi:MbnP family protein [Flavobacterium ponti]|uniref:MbnP family protein n=1 Tax=Flavobacterium ponti TaxID=665133 RepID=A0ABV9P6A1_9FLAO